MKLLAQGPLSHRAEPPALNPWRHLHGGPHCLLSHRKGSVSKSTESESTECPGTCSKCPASVCLVPRVLVTSSRGEVSAEGGMVRVGVLPGCVPCVPGNAWDGKLCPPNGSHVAETSCPKPSLVLFPDAHLFHHRSILHPPALSNLPGPPSVCGFLCHAHLYQWSPNFIIISGHRLGYMCPTCVGQPGTSVSFCRAQLKKKAEQLVPPTRALHDPGTWLSGV